VVNGFSFSFAELFWRVWEQLGYALPAETDLCFMFELMTPYNRVVVRQEANQLTLHGARNVKTLAESEPHLWAQKYGWQSIATYPLHNWEAVLEAAKHLDPLDAEGYIVCDRNFHRVKVKCPQYVAISHLREGFSTRRMLEIIMTNEGEEFLAYYPEWWDLFNRLKSKYEELIAEIEEVYRQHRDIPVQKDFALAIVHLPYSGVLFALRAGKIESARAGLARTTVQNIERLLGLEYVDLGI